MFAYTLTIVCEIFSRVPKSANGPWIAGTGWFYDVEKWRSCRRSATLLDGVLSVVALECFVDYVARTWMNPHILFFRNSTPACSRMIRFRTSKEICQAFTDVLQTKYSPYQVLQNDDKKEKQTKKMGLFEGICLFLSSLLFLGAVVNCRVFAQKVAG